MLWNKCDIIKLLLYFQNNELSRSMKHYAQYFYSKNDNFPKGTTVDTTNLQQGDLTPLDFAFENVASIWGFISMNTVVFQRK